MESHAEEKRATALAKNLDEWKAYSIQEFHKSQEKMKILEDKLDLNNKMMQEMMDMMRLGKLLKSLVTWVIGLVAGGLAIWHGIHKP